MKHLNILLILLISVINIQAQLTAIPDSIFEQKLIAQGYDTGFWDGFVPTANIDTITELTIVSPSGPPHISDLTGIEDFTSLEVLNCSNNMLTTIDLSQNSALRELYIGSNKLTHLDLQNNVNLTKVVAAYNLMDSIDVTSCALLEKLYIQEFNKITEIDLSNNINLTYLDMSKLPITNLDLSNNLMLDSLKLEHTFELQNIDIGNNSVLKYFYTSRSDITSMDLSNCSNLELAYFLQDSLLECVNLKNGNSSSSVVNFGWCVSLNCIQVDDSANFNPGPLFPPAGSWNENCTSPCSFVNVGLEENITEDGLLIYPNPSGGIINIESEGLIREVRLFNSIGKLVYSKRLNEFYFSFEPNLEVGVYFLRIETEGSFVNRKIIVQ